MSGLMLGLGDRGLDSLRLSSALDAESQGASYTMDPHISCPAQMWMSVLRGMAAASRAAST